MKRREQLSNNAVYDMKKIWKQSKVKINKKIKIYKTLVKTILITINKQCSGILRNQLKERSTKY